MSTFNYSGKIIDSFRVEQTPVIEAVGSLRKVYSITADKALGGTSVDSGGLYFVNSTGAVTLTLPAAKAGLTYDFIVATALGGALTFALTDSANNKIVKSETLSDSYNGTEITTFQLPSSTPIGTRLSIVSDGTRFYAHCMSSSAIA